MELVFSFDFSYMFNFYAAETWPFLITLLTKCVTLEISSNKKRLPKLSVAKTLRTAIQCAEDMKFGGKEYIESRNKTENFDCVYYI